MDLKSKLYESAGMQNPAPTQGVEGFTIGRSTESKLTPTAAGPAAAPDWGAASQPAAPAPAPAAPPQQPTFQPQQQQFSPQIQQPAPPPAVQVQPAPPAPAPQPTQQRAYVPSDQPLQHGTPPEQPPQTAIQQSPTPILDEYRSYLSPETQQVYQDDASFTRGLVDEIQRLNTQVQRQQTQLVQASSAIVPDAPQVAPQPAAPTQPEGPSDPVAEYLADLSAPPAVDDAWMRMVDRDERTGLYVPVADFVPPQVVAQVNAAAQWKEKQMQRIADPAFFSGLVDAMDQRQQARQDEIIAAAREQILAEQQASKVDAEMRSFVKENATQLYQMQNGQPMVNPITREPVLTPQGQQFFTAYARGDEMAQRLAGESNPAFAFEYAREQWQSAAPQQQAAPPQQAVQAPAAPVQQEPILGGQPPANGNGYQPTNRLQQQFQQEYANPPTGTQYAQPSELQGSRGAERPGGLTEMMLGAARQQGINLNAY